MKHKILLMAICLPFFATSCNKNSNPTFTKPYIATTSGDLSYTDDYPDDIAAIKGLYKAGFRNIDLNMYKLTEDHAYMQDNWKESVLKLKSTADSLGMKFVQAHSQGGNPLKPEDHDFIVRATNRSIEICEVLGIKNTVVHAGWQDGLTDKQQWFDKNKAFYNELLPTANRCKVNVLCENSTSKNMGDRFYINTGKDMREFIKYVNNPYFHGCWDTGHANCEPNQINNIKDLGDEMYAIHYNDNSGNGDEHVMPCTGTLNNSAIISTLKEINFKGYFTLECDATDRNKYTYHGPDFRNNNKYADISLTSFTRIEQEEWLYKTACYLLDYNA